MRTLASLAFCGVLLPVLLLPACGASTSVSVAPVEAEAEVVAPLSERALAAQRELRAGQWPLFEAQRWAASGSTGQLLQQLEQRFAQEQWAAAAREITAHLRSRTAAPGLVPLLELLWGVARLRDGAEGALSVVESTIQEFPSLVLRYPEALLFLGRCRAASGDEAGAVRAFEFHDELTSAAAEGANEGEVAALTPSPRRAQPASPSVAGSDDAARPSPEALEELERYRLRHSVEGELDVALERLEADVDDFAGGFLMQFHFVANQASLFARVLAVGDPALRAALLARLQLAPGYRLEDDTVEILRAAMVEDDVPLNAFVAILADERLREELERLANAEERPIRRRALASLETLRLLEEPHPERALPFYAADAEGLEVFSARLLPWVDDPRDMAGALIELFDEPRAPEQVYLRLLQWITFCDFAGDPARWRSYWREHADRPYSEWILEVAEGDSELRAAALRRLGTLETTDAEAAILGALRRSLASNTPTIRRAAAASLVACGDPSGASVLIEALRADDLQARVVAMLALARLERTTLGYRPSAAPEEREAALARWILWAQR